MYTYIHICTLLRGGAGRGGGAWAGRREGGGSLVILYIYTYTYIHKYTYLRSTWVKVGALAGYQNNHPQDKKQPPFSSDQ